MLANACSTVQL